MRTRGGYILFLQQDGNLVLYSSSNGVLWQTNTWGAYPIALTMQMDCTLVLYAYPKGLRGDLLSGCGPAARRVTVLYGTLLPCFLDLENCGTLAIYQFGSSNGWQRICILFPGIF
jgi:hypothetical protein